MRWVQLPAQVQRGLGVQTRWKALGLARQEHEHEQERSVPGPALRPQAMEREPRPQELQ
jgi:hypothetical protein